jgi:squalene-hopene/tetraprenyl-beta-curcumene cyclase
MHTQSMHSLPSHPFDHDTETIVTPPPSAPPTQHRWAAESLERGLTHVMTCLTRQQRTDHWVGTLSSSALATAMSTVALKMMDAKHYADQIQRGRRWLIRTQLADGGWGDAVIDEANINATSLAIAALVFTQGEKRDAAEERALSHGLRRLQQFGGWPAVGDPQRCTLSGPCRTVASLAGLMDFKRIKRLRPEVILLPARVRRTISTTFPAYLSIALLHSARGKQPLNWLPTYRSAWRKCLAWLQRAQGPNGSFEESAFLTSVIVMGLCGIGHADLPWLKSAMTFIVESQRGDGGWPIDRDLETFDTDMAVFAFYEAGMPVPHGEKVRAWLLGQQSQEPCFPTNAPAGGWPWAKPSGWPDADDTAYTLMALRALGVPASAPVVRQGGRWLEALQSSSGAWPTFVRDSKMPFDHDCPYITGHVLSALQVTHRLEAHPKVLDRALTYLQHAQRYDGSFTSIWFRESVAGTASVLEALADCGLHDLHMARRARDAILRLQNEDGGWAGMRMQPSSAEETSWAILALLRTPEDAASRRAVDRGVEWLLANQRPDGTWEPTPIALYYSAMWYSDSYYAVSLPAQALARARGRYVDQYAE